MTVLTSGAQELSLETAIPKATIAHAMSLACGFPLALFATDFDDKRDWPAVVTEGPRIERLGVVGAGTMAQGLARAAMNAGIDVELVTRDSGRASAAGEAISERIIAGKANLSVGTNFQSLTDANVIIEAVAEEAKTKQEVLAAIERLVTGDVLLGTTTSSIPVSEIASGLKSRDRLVGLHFFNPADTNPLVEVIASESSSANMGLAYGLGAMMNKTLIEVADTPGFIVNRVLNPYLNEAAKLVGLGYSPRAVDLDIRKRYSMPMGPSRLAGVIGIDVVLAIQESLYRRLGAPELRPAETLSMLIQKNILGDKTGHILPFSLIPDE